MKLAGCNRPHGLGTTCEGEHCLSRRAISAAHVLGWKQASLVLVTDVQKAFRAGALEQQTLLDHLLAGIEESELRARFWQSKYESAINPTKRTPVPPGE